jgi:magnesium-transporting ATPase (P-type)
MVRLLRTKGSKITLAIGDGANDCNMIQEANIGIGIFGNEGMRAVQVSDFAIGEFKLLAKLLLVHGRINYIRIAEMINYFIYKNFVMTMIQVLFQFYSGQSGQTVWNDWFISFYNMIFTTFPVLTKAIYDQDIFLNYLKKIGFYYYVQKVEKMDYIFPYLYSVG